MRSRSSVDGIDWENPEAIKLTIKMHYAGEMI